MEKQEIQIPSLDLWSMMDKTNHELLLIRQRELKPYNIASQQLHILRTIKALGTNATITNIAKKIDGHICIISRQVVILEKDGFVKRMPTPKSRLLKIELTKKGLDIIKIPTKSKVINSIFIDLTGKERQQLYSILNKLLSKSKEQTAAFKG